MACSTTVVHFLPWTASCIPHCLSFHIHSGTIDYLLYGETDARWGGQYGADTGSSRDDIKAIKSIQVCKLGLSTESILCMHSLLISSEHRVTWQIVHGDSEMVEQNNSVICSCSYLMLNCIIKFWMWLSLGVEVTTFEGRIIGHHASLKVYQ